MGLGLGFAGVGWGCGLGCGPEAELELQVELELALGLELELKPELALESNNPTRVACTGGLGARRANFPQSLMFDLRRSNAFRPVLLYWRRWLSPPGSACVVSTPPLPVPLFCFFFFGRSTDRHTGRSWQPPPSLPPSLPPSSSSAGCGSDNSDAPQSCTAEGHRLLQLWMAPMQLPNETGHLLWCAFNDTPTMPCSFSINKAPKGFEEYQTHPTPLPPTNYVIAARRIANSSSFINYVYNFFAVFRPTGPPRPGPRPGPGASPESVRGCGNSPSIVLLDFCGVSRDALAQYLPLTHALIEGLRRDDSQYDLVPLRSSSAGLGLSYNGTAMAQAAQVLRAVRRLGYVTLRAGPQPPAGAALPEFDHTLDIDSTLIRFLRPPINEQQVSLSTLPLPLQSSA